MEKTIGVFMIIILIFSLVPSISLAQNEFKNCLGTEPMTKQNCGVGCCPGDYACLDWCWEQDSTEPQTYTYLCKSQADIDNCLFLCSFDDVDTQSGVLKSFMECPSCPCDLKTAEGEVIPNEKNQCDDLDTFGQVLFTGELDGQRHKDKLFNDQCKDSKILLDWTCENNIPASREVECSKGCVESSDLKSQCSSEILARTPQEIADYIKSKLSANEDIRFDLVRLSDEEYRNLFSEEAKGYLGKDNWLRLVKAAEDISKLRQQIFDYVYTPEHTEYRGVNGDPVTVPEGYNMDATKNYLRSNSNFLESWVQEVYEEMIDRIQNNQKFSDSQNQFRQQLIQTAIDNERKAWVAEESIKARRLREKSNLQIFGDVVASYLPGGVFVTESGAERYRESRGIPDKVFNILGFGAFFDPGLADAAVFVPLLKSKEYAWWEKGLGVMGAVIPAVPSGMLMKAGHAVRQLSTEVVNSIEDSLQALRVVERRAGKVNIKDPVIYMAAGDRMPRAGPSKPLHSADGSLQVSSHTTPFNTKVGGGDVVLADIQKDGSVYKLVA